MPKRKQPPPTPPRAGSLCTMWRLGVLVVVGLSVWLATSSSTLNSMLLGLKVHRQDAPLMQEFFLELRDRHLGEGKVVLVTGTSKGLGRGLAVHLLGSGARLILPLRDVAEQERLRQQLHAAAVSLGYTHKIFGKDDIVFTSLDLASFSSIRDCVASLKKQKLVVDILINNAGLISITDETTKEGFEMTTGVNFLGTAHFTLLLAENNVLSERARVVSVSSEEHNGAPDLDIPSLFEKNTGSSLSLAFNKYGTSKLALVTWSYELARQWSRSRVVYDICPGPVVSDIARNAPWPLPEIVDMLMKLVFVPAYEAALPVLRLALVEEDPEVHWHLSRRRHSDRASDARVGRFLWKALQSVREQEKGK